MSKLIAVWGTPDSGKTTFATKLARSIYEEYQSTVIVVITVALVSIFSVTAFAASGDVAGAITNTWNAAKTQIKSVVNNVVFPVIDLVLAVLFFAKVALAYMRF